MSEKPYKLGQWFWGKLPELPDHAVVAWHSASKNIAPVFPQNTAMAFQVSNDNDGWWCIVSDTDPLPPEPKLRLPEGWESYDDEAFEDKWQLGACGDTHDDVFVHTTVTGQTRGDCIRTIQGIIDGLEARK